MLELKNVYIGKEIKFYHLLKALIPSLTDDFYKAHPDFQSSNKFVSVPYYTNPSGTNDKLYKSTTNEAAWKMSGIKGYGKFKENTKTLYPTGYELASAFGDDCYIACYSIFEPNTILYRHTGVENRKAKYIRIHIPLFIPPGDIGFEVEGQEVYWDDIFAFNNQKLHSGWNNTDQRRLVFLLDLSREILNLPSAPEWYSGMNDHVPVFEKTRDPNLKYEG